MATHNDPNGERYPLESVKFKEYELIIPKSSDSKIKNSYDEIDLNRHSRNRYGKDQGMRLSLDKTSVEMDHYNLNAVRTLAAFTLPQELDMTREEIKQLARPTEEMSLAEAEEAIRMIRISARPRDPELVAVIDVEAPIVIGTVYAWQGAGNIVIGAGRTAVFNIAEFSDQKARIQQNLDQRVALQQPAAE